jgi:hypothetical protein
VPDFVPSLSRATSRSTRQGPTDSYSPHRREDRSGVRPFYRLVWSKATQADGLEGFPFRNLRHTGANAGASGRNESGPGGVWPGTCVDRHDRATLARSFNARNVRKAMSAQRRLPLGPSRRASSSASATVSSAVGTASSRSHDHRPRPGTLARPVLRGGARSPRSPVRTWRRSGGL